ncbi:hypothetical protein [Proteiniborus sp.]
MDVLSHCIIEGNGIKYSCFAQNITIIDYESFEEKMKMKLMLDIDVKEQI